MANQIINDPKDYSEVLRLIETTDPNHADTFNPLFKRLLDNGAFLKALADGIQQDATTHKAEDATTLKKGHVQLNNATNSTSTTQAATANAVKTVSDSLTMHNEDVTKHVTAEERAGWNSVKEAVYNLELLYWMGDN
jgi:uncharacterized protein with von Willebrand factor type A (vWA) domain